MGLANIDVLLNLDPRYSIHHVIRGDKTLDEITVEGPFGIRLIPGASGLLGVVDMEPHDRTQVLAQLAKMGADAGIGSDVISLATAAQEVLVVATPEADPELEKVAPKIKGSQYPGLNAPPLGESYSSGISR